jgi:predicted dithiol-disulfide oxidoreductase (DUF899 family)
MKLSFPNESAEYRAARDRLLEKEIGLRREIEAIARERRALPPGGLLSEDFCFGGLSPGGQPFAIKLSELFLPGQNTLAIYSYMFGPEREMPCPMCTSLLDGIEGVLHHVRQHMNFIVVARSSAARLTTFASERGWRNLSLLSTAGNRYNELYHGEKEGEGDTSMLNVFVRRSGEIRHFWCSEMVESEWDAGQHHRGNDSLSALWNLFDLTPQGRPGWFPKVRYFDVVPSH